MSRDIYLIDLILYVISKWRGVLFSGVLVAVIGAGAFFASAQSSPKQVQPAETEKVEILEETTTSSLKEVTNHEELQEKFKTMQLDGYYTALYAYYDYAGQSARMNLNPNKFYEANVSYIISTKGNIDAHYVAEAYKEGMITTALLQDVTEILNEGYDSQYYRSAFFVEIPGMTADSENQMQEAADHAMIKVTFQDNQEENCEKVIAVIEKWLKKCGEQVESLEEFQIQKLSASVSVCNDPSLTSGQSGTINNMSSMYNGTENIRSSMTEREKKYYEKHSKYASQDVSTEEIVSELVEEFSYKKLLLAGVASFIGGAGIAAVLYIVCYVLSDKLRNKCDLEGCTETLCFAVRSDKNKENKSLFAKLDAAIENLRFREEFLENDCEILFMLLKNYADKHDVGTIYVTGSRMENLEIPKALYDLMEKLENNGIKVSVGESALKSEKSIKECQNSDLVLLLEKRDESQMQKVKAILAKVAYCDIKVAGAVLIH